MSGATLCVARQFDYETNSKIVQKWLRVPPTCIKLQVGMVDALFGDFKFEKAAIKAGAMKAPPKTKRAAA